MNSSTSTHPVTKGPATTSRMGLMARKATMVSLYQRGVWPRKFCQKAFAVLILFSLNCLSPGWLPMGAA